MSGVPDRPPPGSPDISGRLVTIDLWRGLAALAVLAVHAPHHDYSGWRDNWLFPLAELADYGYLGVPVFVVISGFCIHRRAALRAAAGEPGRPGWGRFWKRRFWRLYPTYLAAIVLSLALAPLHGRYAWDEAGVDSAVHLLMVHNLTDEYAAGLANPPFWSLGMEEQLYLLYVPLLAGFALLGGRAVWLAGAVTVGWRTASASGFLQPVGPIGSYHNWPFYFWLHWALGAAAVDAWAGNRTLPTWSSSLKVAAGLALFGIFANRHWIEFLDASRWSGARWLGPLVRHRWQITAVCDLSFAVAFWCVLNRGLAWERSGGVGRLAGVGRAAVGGLASVGLVSYSVYLAHMPVFDLLGRWVDWGDAGTHEGLWVVRYLAFLAAGLAAGWALYWTVERHSVRPVRSPLAGRIAPAAAATGGNG